MNGSTEGASISYNMMNAPLPVLLEFALGLPSDRLILHGVPKDARYSMRLISPGSDTRPLASAIETAIAAAAGLKLTQVTTEEDAYILKPTPQAAARLTPTASKFESMCFMDPRDGKLKMVKTTLDDLAPRLEDALGIPVVNEANISGEFDADFTLPKGDFAADKAALEANLGLTLEKAKRPIERAVFDALPPTATPATPSVAAGTAAPAPSQMIAVPRPQP